MKKVLVIIICVLFAAVAICSGEEKPLANANKDGLYARSIEQVLRLDPNEIDLGTAVLIVSEQWSDMVEGRRYLARLNDMAYEIRMRVRNKGLPLNYKAINVINEYLFEDLGYEAMEDAGKPSDLFLHKVMDNKRGYCLSLSVLYLAIGERLGLPLYGVVAPGHFFVRYDDNNVRFNIETTGKGGYAKDEHYIEKFKVPPGNGSIYMKNLSKLQTLGCFFNNLGNSYNDVGDTEQAQLALERAVEINPSLSESHTNLGNIYLGKDRIDDAIYEYQAALRIKFDDAKTHNNLGNAYSRHGWLNDAISEYTYAVELDPDFTDAYKNMANAYCMQEMYGQAAAKLKYVLTLEPKDANCYNQLGKVYNYMGEYDEAIFQLKQALRINNDLAEAYYEMGVSYGGLNMVNDEIESYKKCLDIKPNMTEALMHLGNIYFREEKYDKAVEYYKKAIQIKPDDGPAHYNIGAAYSNEGKYEEALTEYNKAIELAPEMGDAHHGLAFVYYKLENYDLAIHHLRIAESLGIEVSQDLLEAIEAKM